MRLPWALSLGLFWYVFSQGVYHWLFLGDIFRELFRMGNLQGVFCGGFFRVICCEAVSPGFLSQRRHLCTHPQELFPCASLEWFFACPLSQELLRVFYLVLSSVRFPADQFCWRPIAGVFALRFCAGPLFRAFFRKAFLARSFAGLFPWVFPRCIVRANFRTDGFHGLFRGVVYSALSRGWIFGSIYYGSFSVHFFAGETSMGAFAGGFFVRSFERVSSVQFSAGTFYLHCLVGSFFVLFFVCAFPVELFAQLLPCSLSWGSFPWHSFAVEISIGSYPAAFPVRFFAVAFSARSFAEVFAAHFFSGAFFTTDFRKLLPHSPLQGFSRGLFAGASLVLPFAWTVSNICSEGRFQCPLSPNIF